MNNLMLKGYNSDPEEHIPVTVPAKYPAALAKNILAVSQGSTSNIKVKSRMVGPIILVRTAWKKKPTFVQRCSSQMSTIDNEDLDIMIYE